MSCSRTDIDKAVETKLQNMLKNYSPTDSANNKKISDLVASMGLPSSKMNSVVSNLQSMINCDSECQKAKTAADLRRKLIKARQTEVTAPEYVADAEKNYYVFTKGEVGYKDMLVNRYRKVANVKKNKAEKNHEELMNELETLTKDYQAEDSTLMRMRELLRIRLNENKELRKAIDNDIAAVQTNDRRVVYENWAGEWLGKVRALIKSIYWVLLVFYFVYNPIVDIMANNSINKYFTIDSAKKNIPVMVLGVILPFLVGRIISFILMIIAHLSRFFSNSAPKNVYINLSD
jgi:hypothetical protein